MAAKRSRAPRHSEHAGGVARNPADAGTARPAARQPPRNFAMRGIGALLVPVLRPAFRRRAPAAAHLLADWPELAGPELSARAVPVKFAAGTLTLACASPVAMELQLCAPALIQRLNLGLGRQLVERLRFVAQLQRAAPQAPGRAAPRPPPEDLPEGELGVVLAKLYQGIHAKGRSG